MESCTSPSSVLRACAMGRRVDPSWWTDPLSYFSFQPVLHDMCNKGCGMCYRYLNGPLPCVQRHITVNKNVMSASVNKHFLHAHPLDYP